MSENFAGRLLSVAGGLGARQVVAGFDAFIDETIRIVARRESPTEAVTMRRIEEFGDWILAASGHSGGREFLMEECSAGGCSVNLSDGLAALGLPVHLFAGFGEPPHPAFEPIRERVRQAESCDMGPGRSIVLEFDDGKLILGSFGELEKITPELLAERLPDSAYPAACASASAIVLTSWSVYPHMTRCWKYLLKDLFSSLRHRPRFFFDIADPVGRTPEALREMADTLREFEAVGPVTLSVNGNEARLLARALQLPADTSETLASHAAVEDIASSLRHRIGIDEIVVHLVKSATVAADGETCSADGPFCAKPTRSVGAGDRFNAGYLAALLGGLPPSARLAVANATSGFFVRNSRSGTLEEIADFLLRNP